MSAAYFDFFLGLSLFAFVYLAGIASISGAVAAGIIISGGIFSVILDRWIDTSTWFPIVGAILLIFTAITNPGGFVAGRRHKCNDLSFVSGAPTITGNPR